jgi:DNA polymerase III subunit gamma/tau
MRWSTAPRLTLELALVRSALPETDPQPAALVGRLERLERLAGLDHPAASAPSTGGASASPSSTRGVSSGAASARPGDAGDTEGAATETTVEAPRGVAEGTPLVTEATPSGDQPPATPSAEPSEAPGGGAHAPSAAAVDTEMLRRSWPQVLDALKARRKMVLFASAQVATVGSFDGEQLELVFPPGREVGAAKVEERSSDLVEVLDELFGVTPKVRATVREGTVLVEDEPPSTPEAAEELLRTQFGAEVVDEG